MPGPSKRGVLSRRPHRDDEAEDEGSTAGDLDDISLSEGSAISNGDDEADVEGSEVSAEDEDARALIADTKSADPTADDQTAPGSGSPIRAAVTRTPKAGARAFTNGLRHAHTTNLEEAAQAQVDRASSHTGDRPTASAPQLSAPQETLAERSRREHSEYIKDRNSNPAFVPNRGGFFLHDDRSAASMSSHGRPFPRGRGRGYNTGYGIGRGYIQPTAGPTDRQWAHDLHEAVNKTVASPPVRDTSGSTQIPTAKSAAVAPNRTFSISTVLGNVTIQVFLPGMDSKKTFTTLVKKQHTLLPQHRPPLRRDKPVRISIPDEDPRYIFPSTERSFIFIPRAMRPNQQIYTRGRGRGSYHGSRRASVMGSAYSPSVAMSRKSSVGGAGSTGIHTPTDGSIPRGPMMPNFNRPIVRMPVSAFSASGMPSPMAFNPSHGIPVPFEHSNAGPTILHSPTVALPMHQPRPQKTVSVAEIESPAVKGPQQQQEQPFHQQMPAGVSLAGGPTVQQGQSQQNHAKKTPLSHIPEGAVYAQPFQPYPLYPQGGYYGPAFPGGPVGYQTPADPFSMGVGGPVMPPQFVPGQNYAPAARPSEAGMQPGAISHEKNGMVYYYDSSQYSTDASHMNQYQMAVGGGMVGVPAPGPYFYPIVPGGMFYPTTQ